MSTSAVQDPASSSANLEGGESHAESSRSPTVDVMVEPTEDLVGVWVDSAEDLDAEEPEVPKAKSPPRFMPPTTKVVPLTPTTPPLMGPIQGSFFEGSFKGSTWVGLIGS